MSLLSWIEKVLGRFSGKQRGPAHPATKTKTPVDLTIGLDFGTSTIKCIIRAAVGERRQPERHALPIHGEYLLPSLAWEWKGNLTISHRPHSDARCYRSVKACLRCPILSDEPCRRCFQGTNLTAEVVTWAILSHCVNGIREEVAAIYPAKQYTVNWRTAAEWKMGVPLDGLDQQRLWDLFRDLLWRAVHFGAEVSGTMPCDALGELYKAASAEHPPSRSMWDCVQPEADVAVNAFLESQRNLEDGLYFTMDVGAGTTDIAFFRFAQDAERPIIFYGTSCTRVGVDDFAAAVADCLCSNRPGLRRGEALVEADSIIINGLHGFDLGPPRHGGRLRVFDDVYRRMAEGRHRAFGRAWTKESVWDHWRGLRGVVIGGGAGLPGVASIATQPLSYGNPREAITPEIVSLRIAPLPGATDLHSIAYGLSIPVAEYYENWPPHEVPEIDRGQSLTGGRRPHGDFHDDW